MEKTLSQLAGAIYQIHAKPSTNELEIEQTAGVYEDEINEV